ncbi:MAG: four helix bundle protein [Planctomycetota bacterium]
MNVRSYRDLIAWQKAMDLVAGVYRVTEAFPAREQFGLSYQMRRASVSIPSNIAEGQGRGTTRDYVHFLHISRGSFQELETQLLLAQRLSFAGESEVQSLLSVCDEVSRLVSGLINALVPRP